MERSPLLEPPPPSLTEIGLRKKIVQGFRKYIRFESSAKRSELETAAPFSGVKTFGSRWLLAPKALEASHTHILSSTWRRLKSSSPPGHASQKGWFNRLCQDLCVRAFWSRAFAAKVIGLFFPRNDMTICLKTIYSPREKSSFTKFHW